MRKRERLTVEPDGAPYILKNADKLGRDGWLILTVYQGGDIIRQHLARWSKAA